MTGVVPVGMADGYRPALNGAENAMLVQGRRAPVIGVSLAHTTLDLTSIPGAAVGDEVMVIGAAEQEEVTLESLAAAGAYPPPRSSSRSIVEFGSSTPTFPGRPGCQTFCPTRLGRVTRVRHFGVVDKAAQARGRVRRRKTANELAQ